MPREGAVETVLIVLGVWFLLLAAFVGVMAHHKHVPYPKPPQPYSQQGPRRFAA